MAKQIKVKGKCPLCKSKVEMTSCGYLNEPETYIDIPCCTNENCELYSGYGTRMKYRFINHRTIKIEGIYED